ncbi:MAG: diguanylate cyclase [Chloroflexota bacterium]|nr:diguanylate cyclase [Chloroflexota bacterium]
MSENILYGMLLLLAAGISGVLACTIGRRARSSPSGPPLVVLLLSLVWWSGIYALHFLPVPRPFPLFWVEVTFFGVVTLPGALLAFALSFSGHERLVSRRTVCLLSIEPLLTLLYLWTDPGDGVFLMGATAPTANMILTGGLMFWVNIVYSYVLMLTAIVVLVRQFHRSPLYRRQVGMVLAGVLISWVINLLNLSLTPVKDLDLTSVSFTIAGLFLAYSVYHYRLLDVLPVARHILVEQMGDGVLVLDAQNRIVDANPSMGRLFGVDHRHLIGGKPALLPPRWSDLVMRYRGVYEAEEEVVMEGADGHNPLYIDLRLVRLQRRNGTTTGRLLVVRDITDRKCAEMALQQANEQLNRQVQEITSLQEQLREQAIRDPLTGAFNRRYLDETLQRELAQTARANEPLSLVLLDVDGFKLVNDTFGHAAGDQVLKELAGLLISSVRTGDVVSRYGGEEFIVVLPGVTTAQAEQRAERWRAAFESLQVVHGSAVVGATLSAGVAAFPTHGLTQQDLFHAADYALYNAKHDGRNRVMVYEMPEQEVASLLVSG